MSQPDPSLSVPQDLMQHVHLVSSFRYPAVSHINLQDVAKWLMNAPHVARDKAPFFWTYLDKPADGTVLMTWQPLQRLGTNFASDGFVWAPPEQLYKHDLGNGLHLEIYYLKAGYIPGEQYAQHARRRFRLVPVPGHPAQPQPDSNLFIVHYGPADPNDTMPVTMIPYDQRVHAAMQQRQYLQRAGQIRRKEFMLSDRANWPSLPELTRQQMEPQMAPRGVPQQMAYPPQSVPGPPAKRARHSQGHAQQQPPQFHGAIPMEGAFDDDEDTSRGDMFDHLTPREISLGRYQQNHEWMEEILSSPYRINQITPADLGLGLKGELASLTEGIFTSHGGDAFSQSTDKAYVGRLDAGKADEFRKRVDEHIKAEQAAMDAMKKAHEDLLADMKKMSTLRLKERELRDAEDSGTELWRPTNGNSNEESTKKATEDVVKETETATGLKIESRPSVKCVETGGYQAPAPQPAQPTQPTQMSRQASQNGSQNGSQNSGIMLGESDIDMGGTAAGLLDQMHTGFSSTSTPVNSFPTPQPQLSAAHSNAATPSNINAAASPAVAPSQAQQQQQPPSQLQTQSQSGAQSEAKDIAMGGTDTSDLAPDQGTGSGDWVVVPKEAASNDAGNGAGGTPSGANEGTPKASAVPSKPLSAAATPAVTDPGSATFDHNDFSSLGDLDTAGDALANFDTPGLDGSAGELGDGLDLQMDMEDSAFGDAFHGVDTTGTPGQDL
uniref:DUF1750-domain-containing protein n=1 Tax=Bionectria ochroleuca TaxID=29856 RepID=A0A8H7N8X9_BIOOC